MDIDNQLRQAEGSLIEVMRMKTVELQSKMKNKDMLIIKMNEEFQQLKSRFDTKLDELDSKDDEIMELEQKFTQCMSVIDQKQTLITNMEQEWASKTEKLQESLEVRDYEVKDLQDKLQNYKKEIKFYKKGYLEEVGQYKKDIETLNQEVVDNKNNLNEDFSEKYQKMQAEFDQKLSDIKAKNEESVSIIRDTLTKELSETQQNLDNKNLQIRQLEKDNFSLQANYENLQILKDALDKKVSILNGQINTASTEDYKKMIEMRMELQKNLGIKEHMLAGLQQKVISYEEKVKSIKRKYSLNMNNFQKEYENKILQMVMEYRSEINEKEKELNHVVQENESLKSDMKTLAEKMRESETQMRLIGEDLQTKIREKTREYEENLHKLGNENEVLSLRLEEIEKLNAKLTFDRDDKEDKLGNVRIRVLDLEKENQILIDQLVMLKQRQLDHRLESERGIMDRIEEVESNNPSQVGHQFNNNQGKFNTPKDKNPDAASKLFSSDQGNPSFPEFNYSSNPNLPNALKLSAFSPQMFQSRDMFNEKLQIVASSRLRKNNSGNSPSKVEYLKEENETMKELIDEMRLEMERTSEDYIKQSEKLKAVEEEMEQQLEKIRNKSVEIESLKTEIAKNDEQKKSEFKLELDAKKEECLRLRHDLANQKNMMEITKEELKDAQMQQDELHEKIQSYKNQLEDKNKEIESLSHLTEENEKMRIERDELLRNLSKTRAKMLKYRDNCENVYDNETIDVMLADIQNLRIGNEELQMLVQKKDVENGRLRTQLGRYIYKQPAKKKTTKGKSKDRKSTPVADEDPVTNKKVRNFNIKDDVKFQETET